jgi:hypothetical protein
MFALFCRNDSCQNSILSTPNLYFVCTSCTFDRRWRTIEQRPIRWHLDLEAGDVVDREHSGGLENRERAQSVVQEVGLRFRITQGDSGLSPPRLEPFFRWLKIEKKPDRE